MKILTGWQLVEQYKNGRRDFSNTEIQWADFSNTNLSGVSLSDSKLSIITFYGCNLTNANFSNCEIYGTSFNTANLTDANFDKSRLNWVRLDNVTFKNTIMRNASLIHVTMINCVVSELKMDGTSAISVFYNASEIPDSEIQLLLQEIGNAIQMADLDRRLWLRTSIAPYLQEVDKKDVSQFSGISPYSKEGSQYAQSSNLYQGLDNVFKELIGVYGAKSPYKKGSLYKAKDNY